jgi:hypothetical protein
VVRGDDEIRVRRNVRAAFVMRLQELVVQETLQEVAGFVPAVRTNDGI